MMPEEDEQARTRALGNRETNVPFNFRAGGNCNTFRMVTIERTTEQKHDRKKAQHGSFDCGACVFYRWLLVDLWHDETGQICEACKRASDMMILL